MNTGKRFPHIAKALRELRELSGITQAELARMTHVRFGQQICNIESGMCSIPHGQFASFSIALSCAINSSILSGTVRTDYKTKEEILTELVEAKLRDSRENIWRVAMIQLKKFDQIKGK